MKKITGGEKTTKKHASFKQKMKQNKKNNHNEST